MRISRAGSTALVASSSTSRSGSASWARSSATSCRSPADSDSPRCPTRVSSPWGRPASQSSRPSSAAAARICVVVGVEPAVAHVGARGCRRRGSPPAAPARTLQRSESSATSRRSTPSSRTAPAVGVHQPGEQLGERGLARAGLADDRHPAAGRRGRGRCRAAPAGRPGRRSRRPRSDVERARGQHVRRRRRGRRGRPGCRGCRSRGASRRWRSGRR